MVLNTPIHPQELALPIYNQIVPIYGFTEERGYSAGTAVIIAPGIAITASHVLQGLLENFGYKLREKDIQYNMFLTECHSMATWYVYSTTTWVGTDISVLLITPRNEPAEKKIIKPLQITVDPPEVDELVTAIGYPQTKIDVLKHNHTETNIKIAIEPTISHGPVIEIHRSKRDSVVLRFPCFSVEAQYTSGMSGGAVFNENRELCGLVCSGGDGELSHYSHVTSIWPMSIIPVTIQDNFPEHSNLSLGTTYKILDLAKTGYITMNGYDRISFFKHENGTDGVSRTHK